MTATRRIVDACTRRAMVAVVLVAAAWLVAVPSAQAAVTGVSRVSIGAYGEATSASSHPSISANGRYVVFESAASNLTSGSAYLSGTQIYLRDTVALTTQLVSHGLDGARPSGASHTPVISADGAYVAFVSTSNNLVSSSDTVTNAGTYVWSRATGLITRVDLATGESPFAWGSGQSSTTWWYPAISSEGRYVAFVSPDPALTATSGNGSFQVYRRDMDATGTATPIVEASLSAAGTEGTRPCRYPSISADGGNVAFVTSSKLVTTDTNNVSDVYLWATTATVPVRVSVATSGTESNGASDQPAISGNGRYVAFTSYASNLVTDDTNSALLQDVFVRDLTGGTTVRVDVTTAGTQTVNGSSYNPGISADGRCVSFQSDDDNLGVSGTTYPYYAVFIRDTTSNTLTAVDPITGGTGSLLGNTSISSDGRYVAFDSTSTTLVDSDTNSLRDVFVLDRTPPADAKLSTPKISTNHPRRNRSFYVSGTLQKDPGAKAKVQLKVYRLSGTGNYVYYKTYTCYTAVSGASYKMRMKLPYAAKWHVQAWHPADTLHTLSKSSTRVFKVYH
jgi:TolB protein